VLTRLRLSSQLAQDRVVGTAIEQSSKLRMHAPHGGFVKAVEQTIKLATKSASFQTPISFRFLAGETESGLDVVC